MIELGQKARVNSLDILSRPLPRRAQVADRISSVVGNIRSAAEKVTGARYTREAAQRLARITEGLEEFSPQLTHMYFSQMQDSWALQASAISIYRDPQAVEVKVRTPFDDQTVVEDRLILAKGEKPTVASQVLGDGERNALILPLVKSAQVRSLYQEIRTIVSTLPEVVRDAVNVSSLRSVESLDEAGTLSSVFSHQLSKALPEAKREWLASRCSWVLAVDDTTQAGRVYTLPETGEVLIQTQPYPGTDMSPTYFFGADGLVFGLSSSQDPSDAKRYRLFPTPHTVMQDAQYAAALVLQSLESTDQTLQSKPLQYSKAKKQQATTYGAFLRSVLEAFVNKHNVTPQIEVEQQKPHQMALHVSGINGEVEAHVQHDPSQSTTRLMLRDPQTPGKKGSHFLIISPQGILFNGLKLSEALPSARISEDIVAVRQQVVRLLQGLQEYTPRNGFASTAHWDSFRGTINNTFAYLLSCLGKNGAFILPQHPYKLAFAASPQPERAPHHGTLAHPRRTIARTEQTSAVRSNGPSHLSGVFTKTDLPQPIALSDSIEIGQLRAGSLIDDAVVEKLSRWIAPEPQPTQTPEERANVEGQDSSPAESNRVTADDNAQAPHINEASPDERRAESETPADGDGDRRHDVADVDKAASQGTLRAAPKTAPLKAIKPPQKRRRARVSRGRSGRLPLNGRISNNQ